MSDVGDMKYSIHITTFIISKSNTTFALKGLELCNVNSFDHCSWFYFYTDSYTDDT